MFFIFAIAFVSAAEQFQSLSVCREANRTFPHTLDWMDSFGFEKVQNAVRVIGESGEHATETGQNRAGDEYYFITQKIGESKSAELLYRFRLHLLQMSVASLADFFKFGCRMYEDRGELFVATREGAYRVSKSAFLKTPIETRLKFYVSAINAVQLAEDIGCVYTSLRMKDFFALDKDANVLVLVRPHALQLRRSHAAVTLSRVGPSAYTKSLLSLSKYDKSTERGYLKVEIDNVWNSLNVLWMIKKAETAVKRRNELEERLQDRILKYIRETFDTRTQSLPTLKEIKIYVERTLQLFDQVNNGGL